MKLCRFWQLVAGLTSESQNWLARGASAHREYCPACTQAWHDTERIAHQLTLAPNHLRAKAPSRLASRVAAGVALAERRNPPQPSESRLFPILVSAVTIVAIVIAAVTWNRGTRSQAESNSLLSLATLEEVRTRIPLPDQQRLQAFNDAVERPLRAEIEAMKADVRTVTDYLSRTLLPKDLLAESQR